MFDRNNLILHEKRKNIKKNYECLGNVFYFDYDIMIDIHGNVLIEKTTHTIKETDYVPRKEILVQINDNQIVKPLILEIYKDILDTTYELLEEQLESQLKRIINLKNTDPLLIATVEEEFTRCRNKINNYKTQSSISKELIKTYQFKINEMRKIIEDNKNIHNEEVQKLMITISNIYRHL